MILSVSLAEVLFKVGATGLVVLPRRHEDSVLGGGDMTSVCC